jgi:hypothetical protein
MPVLKTVRSIFTTETKDFSEPLKEAAQQVDDFKNKNDAAGKEVGKFQGAMLKFSDIVKGFLTSQLIMQAGQELVQFGKDSIRAASDVEEMQSKFNVVFRETAGGVSEELAVMAEAMNRSRYDLMGYAATFQDTFVPLGFARDQAADMSVQLVQLAEDLASFNNLRTADVARDLQSALVGNTETVRKYGVVANETAIKAKAMELGLWDGTEAIDAQAKAMAILQIILDSTADAQGDAVRTADSFANSSKGLEAAIKDLQIEIGRGLIPRLEATLPLVKETVIGLSDWYRANNVLDEALIAGAITRSDYYEMQRLIRLGILKVAEAEDLAGGRLAYHNQMLEWANTEQKEFADMAKRAGDAAGTSADQVGDAAVSYGELASATDRINSALKTYSERMLFEKLREHLAPEVAMRLGVELGVIDEKVLLIDQALPGLIEHFDDTEDGLIDSTEAAAGFYDSILKINDAISKVPDEVTTRFIFEQVGTIPDVHRAGEPYEKQAEGGEVYAGRPYIVGERGWEPFIPEVDGRILSHEDAMRALAGGGGRGGVVIEGDVVIQQQPGQDGRQLAREFLAEIEAEYRLRAAAGMDYAGL